MRQSGPYKFIAVLLLLSALWPSLSWAEALRGVGIVITLMGQATVVRSAIPQQVLPLKFRDELFYRDRISTQERSIVRVLMGDKALVTVRELSELTITDEPGRPSIVDLAMGKVSLAVTRSRMKPGEPIEVRTHNAVVGIRGTVLVVEVTPAFTTEVYVLKGSVEVIPSGAPSASVFVNAFQHVTVRGNAVGPITSIPPSAVDQIVQDLKPSYQHTEIPDEMKQAVKEIEQYKTQALAKALASKPATQEIAEDQLQEATNKDAKPIPKVKEPKPSEDPSLSITESEPVTETTAPTSTKEPSPSASITATMGPTSTKGPSSSASIIATTGPTRR